MKYQKRAILKKCQNKVDFLICELFFIKELNPMIETMLKRKQTQSTRNHSQQTRKSQANVFNMTQLQKSEAIYNSV